MPFLVSPVDCMSRQSSLAAVVFDMDGLIFNSEHLYNEIGRQLLARRGKELTNDLTDAMMGRTSHAALSLMIQWHDLDATVADLQCETDEIFDQLLDSHLGLMPGCTDLLDALENANVPRAIATSSLRDKAELMLARFHLVSQFQFILTAENVVIGKPHPEIYLTAAKRLDIPPAVMMVLEDSENGCRAAVNAGAFTVAVPGEYHQNQSFTGVAFIANSLKDQRIYDVLCLA